MPWSSGQLQSADQYQYFSCTGGILLSLNILNNALDWSFRRQDGSYPLNDETSPPSSISRPVQTDEIRFKNHAAGQAAVITLTVQTDNEVPSNRPLVASSTPNYLTIDPVTGKVSADFTGHIHARGFDLDAGPSGSPPDEDRIRWLFPSGTPAAGLFGYGQETLLEVMNVGAGSIDNSTSDRAVISFSVVPGGLKEILLAAGLETPRLIDSNGASDFIIKDATGAWGRTTLTPLGAPFAAKVINHNLGTIPSYINTFLDGYSANAPWVDSGVFATTATQMRIASQTLGGGAFPAGIGLYWEARI